MSEKYDAIYDAVSNEFAAVGDIAKAAILEVNRKAIEPSVLYRPTLSIDGNQWCALYGENLQDGVAGFGDSPQEAMHAFNQAWAKRLKEASL